MTDGFDVILRTMQLRGEAMLPAFLLDEAGDAESLANGVTGAELAHLCAMAWALDTCYNEERLAAIAALEEWPDWYGAFVEEILKRNELWEETNND